MSTGGFAREELGIGNWPIDDSGSVISAATWRALLDAESRVESRPSFALDVSPSQSHAAIGVAGRRADGLTHVEVTGRDGVIDHRAGTDWVVPRLLQLKAASSGFSLTIAEGSAAKSLIPEIEAAGIVCNLVKSGDVTAACGLFYAEAEKGSLRHIGQKALDSAVAGAAQADVGDGAWKWARRKSSTDITPLYAVTAALWAVNHAKPTPTVW
jgi:hypothetical protein